MSSTYLLGTRLLYYSAYDLTVATGAEAGHECSLGKTGLQQHHQVRHLRRALNSSHSSPHQLTHFHLSKPQPKFLHHHTHPSSVRFQELTEFEPLITAHEEKRTVSGTVLQARVTHSTTISSPFQTTPNSFDAILLRRRENAR